jgi:hypothetical protein
VSRHRFAGRLSIALLAGISILAADAAGTRASMLAMACCAKMKGDCAGVKSPDDCCRGMGHATASPPSNTPQSKSTFASPQLLGEFVSATTAADSGSTVLISIAFKRPHDPPHLHAFALLI